jgi:phosphate butyryltransferase
MLFKTLDDLIKIALQKRNKNNRMALVMAEEKFAIQAAKKASEMGLITPFLIGDSTKIQKIAESESFNLSKTVILHANTEIEASHIAINLIKEQKADMIMKGLVHTKILLREIVSEKSGLTGNQIMSHFAIFESPFYHKPFGLTDAAMNINPTIEEKVAIIENAINAFKKLGILRPKIAVLAAIENVNSKIQATIDAEYLATKSKLADRKNCIIEGPLSLDMAISQEAANIKGKASQVAGDADILVAPELNSGNILYKCLDYLGNARLAGVILGASCPIILTSRADSEESKLYSIALAICLV